MTEIPRLRVVAVPAFPIDPVVIARAEALDAHLAEILTPEAKQRLDAQVVAQHTDWLLRGDDLER